ncbi:hypothetical protein LBUL_1795 [Lactobacillus delbrueckii subsp. bulgaricus ATCC BAA-365]|nr:hypothetical protein LBUL_1795 [Lactobacillus delbrueckii subsp. bulgaricus ATCC BAA-365]
MGKKTILRALDIFSTALWLSGL